MNRHLFPAGLISLVCLTSFACAQTPEEIQAETQRKTEIQLAKTYYLSTDELDKAEAICKQYFTKQWPYDVNGETKTEAGTLTLVKPDDSNANGLVTCQGIRRDLNGTLITETVYGPYRPDAGNAVSPEDAVR
jgi:hypothetical protein